LHENFTIPNIPSKALDYFNVGIPVLASLDRTTDFGEILDKNHCGLWSYAGDHLHLIRNLIEIYSNRGLKKVLGRNGKSYFLNNLLPENAYLTIIKAIN
jgi:hypothetical protein